jgi:tetratricopeptide (TPR) repeat protein
MFLKPASKLTPRMTTLAVVGILAVAPVPAVMADPPSQHDRCVADAAKDPAAGLAQATQWLHKGGGPEADHCRAMALYDLRRYPEAAKAFEKAARGIAGNAPAIAAQVYDQAGQAWLVANRPGSAETDFAAALQLTPKDPDLLIDRAEALAADRKYLAAIADLNEAAKLAPNRAVIYAYRAAAHRALDQLDAARRDIARNLKLAPNNPVGLLERGNIRRLEGDITGAHRDWLEVARLAPGSPEGAAARQNLARLGAIRPSPEPDHRPGRGPS